MCQLCESSPRSPIATIYRAAPARGVSLTTIDTLIAVIALEHGALLVHNDRDFVALARVEPALMVFPGRAH